MKHHSINKATITVIGRDPSFFGHGKIKNLNILGGNLFGINLCSTKLPKANLSDADLSDTDLMKVILYVANLSCTELNNFAIE